MYLRKHEQLSLGSDPIIPNFSRGGGGGVVQTKGEVKLGKIEEGERRLLLGEKGGVIIGRENKQNKK